MEWPRLGSGRERLRPFGLRSDGEPARFVAHRWQGVEWTHWISHVGPETGPETGPGTLYVTGDGPDRADIEWARRLSARTGGPVAVLWNVPNQPTAPLQPGDLREDDLIASTFEAFLATGDPERVLLVPMVRSVLAALDVCGWEPAVLTGASKRAWTCWLAAATGDSRIAGIAPIVFDNLAMDVQIQRQVALWGVTSPRIRAYTDRGLHTTVETREGQALLDLVDPVRQGVHVPLLSITGTRDPYWATDALSAYWHKVAGPKWCTAVPNLGHDLPDLDFGLPTLAAFVRHVLAGSPIPRLDWTLSDRTIQATASEAAVWQAWGCRSTDLWFSDKPWWPAGPPTTGLAAGHTVQAVGGDSAAGLLAASFDGESGPILLTTAAVVAPA